MAASAKTRDQSPFVAVVYDELARKSIEEMSSRLGTSFSLAPYVEKVDADLERQARDLMVKIFGSAAAPPPVTQSQGGAANVSSAKSSAKSCHAHQFLVHFEMRSQLLQPSLLPSAGPLMLVLVEMFSVKVIAEVLAVGSPRAGHR